MNTHRKTRQLKALAQEHEKLPLGNLLRYWAWMRMLRRVLRARKMAKGMTNAMETWMALSAAATTTRIESQQCGWLHKVSICATMQECDEMTYQCRPGDPQILEYLAMESLGPTVNAEQSHSNLEISVEHTKSKLLTLDALTRCGRCGGLETESDGRGMLLLSARVRGSADEELRTTDEEQTR